MLSEAIRYRDSNDNTLLHYAAASITPSLTSLIHLVDMLLTLHINPLCQNRDGDTPIALAIKAGNMEVARKLLSKVTGGNNLSRECKNALYSDDWQSLERLLCLSTTPSNELEQLSVSSLLLDLCSVPQFYYDAAGKDPLCNKSMDLLVKSFHSDIQSAEDGSLVLMKVLGIDNRRTVLMAALRAGNTCLAMNILSQIDGRPQNDQSASELFHEFLNKIDVDGETAKSEAIRRGNQEVVAKLLSLKVDIEWQLGSLKILALQVACQSLRYLKAGTITDMLLAYGGGSLAIEDEVGNTLLHYLAFGAHGLDTISAMDYVIKRSPSHALLDKRNKEGQTPLHFAVFGGIRRNVAFLIGLGAQIDIVDVRGYTIFHLATDEG